MQSVCFAPHFRYDAVLNASMGHQLKPLHGNQGHNRIQRVREQEFMSLILDA